MHNLKISMQVSGFTFIRNAIQYDYPIREAILSIAPLCDEIVVAVGKSEDETLELVQSVLPEKVRIIETVWDDNLRTGGKVLAEETNKAYRAIRDDTDWCFYIQGDEVLHEKDIELLRTAMQTHKDNPRVEGLLFNYLHFYGSYDYVGDSRKWYQHEIRTVRKDAAITSYKDAQGFRKNGRKLQVKKTNATIHHYGWVKHPEQQQGKQQSFNKYWHDDNWMTDNIPPVAEFDYSAVDTLRPFNGSHPAVMQERIRKMNWQFSFDPSQKTPSLKNMFSNTIERLTGVRLGEYRNYRVI